MSMKDLRGGSREDESFGLKRLIFLFLLGGGSSAYAGPDIHYNYGGLYGGFGLGAAALRAPVTYTDTEEGQGKSTFTGAGACYQLYGGYLKEMGNARLLIGGEVSFHGSTAKKTSSVGVSGQPPEEQLTLKRQFGVTPSAIVAKMLSPQLMPYAKIGYEFSRFQASISNGPSIVVSVKGIVPGVGLNYRWSPQMWIGVVYEHALLFPNKSLYKEGTTQIQAKPGEHRLVLRVSFVSSLLS